MRKSETYTKFESEYHRNVYWTGECVQCNGDMLQLFARLAPRRFSVPADKEGYNVNTALFPYHIVTKEIALGCIKGDPQGYGTHVFKVRKPVGKDIFFAIWLCGAQCWPPEIDLCEVYENRGNNYRHNILFNVFESNIHHRLDGKHIAVGARRSLNIIPKRDIDTWKCEFTHNHIKIWYNGVLIRRCSNKQVMAHFNEHPQLYPIVNLQVPPEYDPYSISIRESSLYVSHIFEPLK